ncbi:MAG: hypothetical protein FWF15_05460 [Oscillospiraceae bacterium]|nr:hypothetical protein [Oscillospiraceae bacterium]
MGKKVSAEEFGGAIINALKDYSDDVAEGTHKAVDKVSKMVMAEINANITFQQRTGDYVKSFSIKKSFEDKYNKRNTWHVKAPHYRLTHLLEHGHRTRNGGMTRAFPHIKYGAELARRELPALMEKVIRGEKI